MNKVKPQLNSYKHEKLTHFRSLSNAVYEEYI